MKVLYILHQYFPYYYTGTELLTDNLSRYERYLGLDTEVWSYKPIKGTRLSDLEVTDYKGVPVTFFSHHQANEERDRKLFRENRKNEKVFEDLLNKSKPDVIHVTHAARMGDIVQIADQLGIPYITTLTDYWLLCPTTTLYRKNGELCMGPIVDPKCLKVCFHNDKEFMSERMKAVENFLSKASKVAYAAEFLRNMFERNGFDTKNWVNIRHGYNPKGERVRIKDMVYRFAFTGTLQPSKGAHIVIQAFRKIKDKNSRLVIYGDPKYEVRYSNYCLKLAEGDKRIEFRGRYDHTVLTKEFKDLDCILVPSNWFEPFPFTLINAVTYGFDVIGARIGGIPEIIGEENRDSLFEAGSVDDLCKKMLRKIENGKNNKQPIFYEQTLESEGFEYFKIYNSVKNR